jgi:hypothetical protein
MTLSREFSRPSVRSRRRMTGLSRAALLAATLSLGFAASLSAELVIFGDGRVVKAATYVVRGDELEIGLPGGGSFSVDMARVDRIVDDEVVSAAAVAEAAPPKPASVAYDLGYRHDRKPLFKTAYDSVIDAEARRFNVDAGLVSALIRAESNFEPRAVSRKGARGLMQLMPATARRLDVRRPFDPVSNVRGGVKYLRELLDRFENKPELVLAAYNAGEGAVENYGGVPPYRETVGYVKRILSWWSPAVLPAAAPASVPVGR